MKTRESQQGSSWSIVGLEVDWRSLEDEYRRVNLVPQVVGRASRIAIPIYLDKQRVRAMGLDPVEAAVFSEEKLSG